MLTKVQTIDAAEKKLAEAVEFWKANPVTKPTDKAISQASHGYQVGWTDCIAWLEAQGALKLETRRQKDRR